MSEEIKKKRVMTRIGDIFCVELEDRKVYFQFIAVDTSCLNSTTIRVFKKEFPMDYIFNADEVVQGEVSFYAHTCLQPGLKQGLWTKVGKSMDVGNLGKTLFRYTNDFTPERLKSYHWWISGINGEDTMIGELTDEYKKKTHMGWVSPPSGIIEKIKFGEYPGVMPY